MKIKNVHCSRSLWRSFNISRIETFYKQFIDTHSELLGDGVAQSARTSDPAGALGSIPTEEDANVRLYNREIGTTTSISWKRTIIHCKQMFIVQAHVRCL